MLRWIWITVLTAAVTSGCLRIPAAEDQGFSGVREAEPQPAAEAAGLLLLTGDGTASEKPAVDGGIRPVVHQAPAASALTEGNSLDTLPPAQRTVHTSDVFTDANLPLWR